MELISKKINNSLNDIVGKCFEINRMLDRGMSLLSVEWKMIRSAEILHPVLAHAYIGDDFADGISGYQASRDMLTSYPQTPAGGKTYSSVSEFFQELLSENIELEEMIKKTILVAKNEGDVSTRLYLNALLTRLVKYTALSNDLLDLVNNCDNDKYKLMMLDSHINNYINV